MSDGQRLFRTDDEGTFSHLCLIDIHQFLIIHDVSLVHRLNHLGVFPEGNAHQGHQLIVLFHEAVGLGQDDNIPVVAYALKVLQRNGVGHAPVEHFHAFQLHHFRGQWHRGRGTDPVVGEGRAFFQFLVDGLPRLHICADGIELHRILLKGLVVEDVVLRGDDVIAELSIVEVARLPPRQPTAIALVACEPLIISEGASWLSRLVVTPEGRPCRDADETVRLNACLHHHIKDPCRKQPPHCTAF